MAEIVEITDSSRDNNAKWNPYIGVEVEKLIEHKGFVSEPGKINESGERIINENFGIMEMCSNPEEEGVETGLVLGYVQSGKTLSFTTLTAMARDNNFQIVIIIAGTSTALSNQTYDRLRNDLRLNNRYDRKWTILQNVKVEDKDTIDMKLEQWRDKSYPRENCSTVLITVMKNPHHLKNLINTLRNVNLSGIPALIIDDESDQASLNTKARTNARDGFDVNEGDASTIYRRINNLRRLFNNHTLLQYTATPQSLLFINIMERLSPNFIKLLTPGKEYAGGKEFFINNSELIKSYPSHQLQVGFLLKILGVELVQL